MIVLLLSGAAPGMTTTADTRGYYFRDVHPVDAQ